MAGIKSHVRKSKDRPKARRRKNECVRDKVDRSKSSTTGIHASSVGGLTFLRHKRSWIVAHVNTSALHCVCVHRKLVVASPSWIASRDTVTAACALQLLPSADEPDRTTPNGYGYTQYG
ncbi:hypothetical protein QTP88_022186 [Uroleucon formosanum]